MEIMKKELANCHVQITKLQEREKALMDRLIQILKFCWPMELNLFKSISHFPVIVYISFYFSFYEILDFFSISK